MDKQNMSNEQIYESLRSHGYNVAANYRQRARKIIEQLLWGIKAIVGEKRWREVSPEAMEQFIDELPGILNFYLDDTDKRYSSLPLTEEQITKIEQNMASQKSTFIHTDDHIVIIMEPTENPPSKEDNHAR